jgi:cysteine desulfurase
MFFKELLRLRKKVYLDNNATTQVSPNVARKMYRVLRNNYGNPSSLYTSAIQSQMIIDESRNLIAKTINAKPEEIIFTGSASEANNTVLKSLSEIFYPNKNKIISTAIEHASVISTLDYLKTKGIIVDYMPVDSKGRIQIELVEKMIDNKTFLISFIYANNEIGTVQNIQSLVQLARKHNILIMADCVQAYGKIPVNVSSLDLDYAIFAAHKIHGPKGIGILYVKSGSPISPFIHGGHQEASMRAGTESIHNIAGFAEACKSVNSMIFKYQKIAGLKDYFVEELKKIKPDILINSPVDACLPNTVSITFPGVNNAYFIATLDYYGISVSAGSACNTQSNDPSHVLTAIGLTDEQARETIRFSMPDSITLSQLKYSLEIIKEFLTGKFPPVGIIEPKQLDESMIFSPAVYILDVRFWHDRVYMKGLPNSVEIPFFSFQKYLKDIPKDKKIIVICQAGYNSPVVAYTMKTKGFKDVNFLMLGLLGWRKANPVLYEKFKIF